MLACVAKCNGDCSSVDKSTLSWVKIDEAGINHDAQVLAAQDMIDQDTTWTTTVLASLAPGDCVFRHETIALHGAGSANGAQAYPQCISIAVTGSGTKQLPAGTLGINLYKADDPGVLFNPYVQIDEYVIPGPVLWTG
jgi:lytic cellulose monooxygenase (C1-hydroxylating)